MDNAGLVRVTMQADGYYPQALRWQGRAVRVLSVEAVRTWGLERRYRVRTTEGRYELGLHTGSGAWVVRRSPGWLSRVWARAQRTPRYPLPAWQRRARAQPRRPVSVSPAQATGGSHAVRLALVRQ